MKLKPLILSTFKYPKLSGGYQRYYEILKRGKSHGIDYVVVLDSQSFENAVKIFPDFISIIKQYKTYVRVLPSSGFKVDGLRQIHTYGDVFHFALFMSRVAEVEDVDLIISGDVLNEILCCYLTSIICSKRWTIIFQGISRILQPTKSIGPLNPLNILSHVSSKKHLSNLSLLSKIGFGVGLLLFLNASERTIALSVSSSLTQDFGIIAPKINFLTIMPGNGVNLKGCPKHAGASMLKYDAIFFGRLNADKGIYDLLEIWQDAVAVFPDAKLGVCGIIENQSIATKFFEEIKRKLLEKNIEYLGEKTKSALFPLVSQSSLTIYPSYLDAFPLVPIESLACGTPVVAYNTSAIWHNFANCKAVFRCPVGDKKRMASMILQVLEMKGRGNLSAEAVKYASSYDWSNVVEAEKKAYQQILGWKSDA